MTGWTNEQRRDIRNAALNKHPRGTSIAAGVLVALLAIPIIILWGAAIIRLWQWAF